MKTITMHVKEFGSYIHERAAAEARKAVEPTVVVMEFLGGPDQKVYSRSCATDGEPTLALEYLEHLLKTHDYTYQYSDGHRAWSRGRAEWETINEVLQVLKARGINYDALSVKYLAPIKEN